MKFNKNSLNKNSLYKNNLNKAVAISIFGGSVFYSLPVYSTLIHNFGISAKALGGANTALPQDSLAAASNPAGMVFLDNRLDVGVSVLSPLREYQNFSAPNLNTAIFPPFTAFNDRTVESDTNYFPIPHAGANYRLDENSVLGLSAYFVGVNTDYPPVDPLGLNSNVGPFASGAAGSDVVHGELALTYARRWGGLALGASAVLAYQRMEIHGTDLFGSNVFGIALPNNTDTAVLMADGNADAFSGRGFDHAFGVGAKLGLLWQVTPTFNLGLAYHSEVITQTHDKYADVIPGDDNAVNNPPQLTVGLAWRPLQNWAVVADIHQIYYTDTAFYQHGFGDFVDRCLLPTIPGTPNFGHQQKSYCFGGSQGPGLGWEDVTIYRIGLQWQIRNDLIGRMGYSHGNNPIGGEDVLFAVLLPTITEDTYTIGMSKRFGNKNQYELDVTGFYSPENSIVGPLGFVRLNVSQFELGVNWAVHF